MIFKGGTSLSKGWGLITRFSEDVDLFVNPSLFTPPPGKNKINKILKGLTETVASYPPLDWRQEEGETIKGLGRNDVLVYKSRFGDLPGLRAAVRLEPGIQSGSFPTTEEPITSLLAQFLREQPVDDFLGLDDIEGFEMHLLHFRRTFVEKMFAVHGKVERLLSEDHRLERDARHYSDLHTLAGRHEVRSMLATPEFEEICRDYDERSKKFFRKAYRPPPGLSFKDSPALFPDPELRARLGAEYESECAPLFSGQQYADFDEVLDRFGEIAHFSDLSGRSSPRGPRSASRSRRGGRRRQVGDGDDLEDVADAGAEGDPELAHGGGVGGIGGLLGAGVADGGEGALDGAEDVGDRDLVGGAGEPIAAGGAAAAVDEAGAAQLVEDVFEEAGGDFLGRGDRLALAALAVLGASQLDGRPHRVVDLC